MARPVVFLVWSGLFMLAYGVVIVLIHCRTSDHPYLLMVTHHQFIKIDAGLGLWLERRLGNQLPEVLGGLVVNLVAVKVSSIRQVDLRARNVEKAQGIALCLFPGLFRVYDVIRGACDLCNTFHGRTQSTKRMNDCHLKYLPR